MRIFFSFVLCLPFAVLSIAQQPPAPTAPGALAAVSAPPNYLLAPGDQMVIAASDYPAIGATVIDGEGMIDLPGLGVFRAAGLTVQELREILLNRMRIDFLNPQVSITITQLNGAPIFLVGAFGRAGTYTLRGDQTLLSMLSIAGGLLPNADRRIKLTRRTEYGVIPLPDAVQSPDKAFSSAEISLASLQQNIDPANDIPLKPYDVLLANPANPIYINGGLAKIGPLDLGGRESIPVSQVVILAGGLVPDAMPDKARVLRPVLDTSRRAEIPLDLAPILEGKASDFPLLPNDILYVPVKPPSSQSAWRRILITSAISAGIGISTFLLYDAIRQ